MPYNYPMSNDATLYAYCAGKNCYVLNKEGDYVFTGSVSEAFDYARKLDKHLHLVS